MRVLVTGGAGYIGSVLVPRLLQSGHQVRVLDSLLFGGEGLLGVCGHPEFQFVKGDIRDQDAVAEALSGAEAVIHLAALVGEPACAKDEGEAEDVNVGATEELLKLARAAGVNRFLLASTCSNYGVRQPGDVADESSELQPLSVYARTKIAAERAAQGACSGDFATAVLRFATVYGLSPRMRFDLLLNEFARDAAAQGWLLIYGPKSWRPFVHVWDLTRFVCERLSFFDGACNVGGHNRRKEKLAAHLRLLAPDCRVEYKANVSDPRDYKVSFEKAKSLGFRPRFAPEQGLSEVLRAVRDGFFGDPYSGRHRNA